MGSDSDSGHTARDAFAPAVAESFPDREPTLPVASVARRLGVAPSTLRTWDRRYGLGPSKHTGGRHRRYRAADIGRLELMQRALLQGASTAEAARYALEHHAFEQHALEQNALEQDTLEQPHAPGSPSKQGASVDLADESTSQAASESALLSASNHGASNHGFTNESGGFEVDGSAPSLLARRLSHAARTMDVGMAELVLAESIDDAGVFNAWQAVIHPVLSALSTRNEGTNLGVEAQYLFSECVLAALIRATPILAEPRNQRPIFLGRAPAEQGKLPLYALAASLAERGIRSQLFGMSLSRDVLTAAIRRSVPAAVVLLSLREKSADVGLLSTLTRPRYRSRLFAYGCGWQGSSLPSKVELLPDFATAVDRVEYILLGSARG